MLCYNLFLYGASIFTMKMTQCQLCNLSTSVSVSILFMEVIVSSADVSVFCKHYGCSESEHFNMVDAYFSGDI